MDITPSSALRPRLRLSDIRGVVQLATQATVGVADITEGVHQSVWRTLGAPDGEAPGRTRGITGLVYGSVRGVTRLVGGAADMMLAGIHRALGPTDDDDPVSPRREAVLAALNGVIGDRLEAIGSPFATPMTLRYRGEALDRRDPPATPEATGKVLLLIHGLCMNDLQWRTRRGAEAVDHGETLAAAAGFTPLYLRYNSGLHPAHNGRELSRLLERLVESWPVPLVELAVLAHSMGGLVIRSACRWAEADRSQWRKRLRSIVFLGTPHHGAPLEQAGSWVDAILSSTPYTRPFAALGLARSAGITALRYGSVVEDASDDPRGRERPVVVALPAGVACHAVAATTAASPGVLADHVLGDGLVPVPSALGRHRDPSRDLGIPESSQWIAFRTGHLQLLSSPEVTRQLARWFIPRSQ